MTDGSLGRELGSPVRHHVHWKSMQAKYMVHLYLAEGSFDDSEYDSVTTRARQAANEIHRNVRPKTMWNRQGLKKPYRGLVGMFMLIADDTVLDVIPNVVVQGRSPKPLTK